MLIDLDAVRAIASQLYAPRIEQQYGAAGAIALRDLLAAIHEVHRRVAYEGISEGLTIFAPLDGEEPLDPDGSTEVGFAELAPLVRNGATIQVLSADRVRCWSGHVADPIAVATTSVVYCFTDADYFVLAGQLERVANPTAFPSAFGVPTFVDLDHALEYYGLQLARHSSCYILQECWFDQGRLFLKNKPESTMRRSLGQHLRSTLRGHDLIEIREEQNVDETHPVDIKVTWSHTNRIAIIEVKWLGDSVNVDATDCGTTYRDARANEGATQLSEYLDANVVRSPQHVTRGYLAVFDARRRGLTSLATQLSAEDARYYATRDVQYDPQRHTTRHDFAPPRRFYLEPAVA